jgi:hypothetical protein
MAELPCFTAIERFRSRQQNFVPKCLQTLGAHPHSTLRYLTVSIIALSKPGTS